METACCLTSESACSDEAEYIDAGQASMCTAEGRQTMIRSMFSDNYTACAGNCTDAALDVHAGFFYRMFDFPAGSDMDALPSRKVIASLREFVCANQDVITCVATPTGAGYEACNSDDDDDDDDEASSTDPVALLAECDVALAVTVSMELTVDNPAEFVADDANKVAVEAGIAEAAGVEAGDVEAVLTVASARRLQESLRRLQGGVDVAATIYTANAAAATAMVDTVGNINATEMTTAIADAFDDAGINITIEVAEIEPAATQSAAQAAAETASSSSGTVDRGDADGAQKASVAAGILAVFAVFAATM